MSTEPKDVIDHLAGIAPGSPLDAIRARRLQARDNAQKSYLSLFAPADFGDVPAADRYAVAAFVAGLHDQPAITDFYLARLARAGGRADLIDALKIEIDRGKTKGPYGAFPAGPLSAENTAGLIYHVAADRNSILGAKLAAALEHTHMLVFRPRDSAPRAIQALLDAGWSTNAIVTLSQLVAFLSFQVRSVVGLRVLGASLGRRAPAAAKAS